MPRLGPIRWAIGTLRDVPYLRMCRLTLGRPDRNFRSASHRGWAKVNGTAKKVMATPLPSGQARSGGYTGAANGGGSRINQYTLVQDVCLESRPIPTVYSSFYVTSSLRQGDGLLPHSPPASYGGWNNGRHYLDPRPYVVSCRDDRFLRSGAARTFRRKYIDGTLVATQSTEHDPTDGMEPRCQQRLLLLPITWRDGHPGSSAAYYTDSAHERPADRRPRWRKRAGD